MNYIHVFEKNAVYTMLIFIMVCGSMLQLFVNQNIQKTDLKLSLECTATVLKLK